MAAKKIILKLDVSDDRSKQKAMKTVSAFPGVTSLAMEMKDKKLTVIGDVDPILLVSKLRKICQAELISVGPAKEPEKKKEEPKKEEKKDTKDQMADLAKAYQAFNPQYPAYYYRPVEEDPNACVIC